MSSQNKISRLSRSNLARLDRQIQAEIGDLTIPSEHFLDLLKLVNWETGGLTSWLSSDLPTYQCTNLPMYQCTNLRQGEPYGYTYH